jgi:hypothetical protein
MILQRTETVNFNPAKQEHRAAVVAFMKRTAWSDTKLRFTHDPKFNSIADQVRARMLEWYISEDTGIESYAEPT